MHFVEKMKKEGYFIAKEVLSPKTVRKLREESEKLIQNDTSYGVRQALKKSQLFKSIAFSKELTDLVSPLIGKEARPIKAIFFDKTQESNWLVPWHQDVTIAVKEKKERPHYHPWSIKEAIHHVQPHVEVLESIITLRIHFDDTDESNGALEVIPASHDQGKFTHAEVQQWVETKEKVLCEVKAGDVVMMQPTTLHASKKGRTPLVEEYCISNIRHICWKRD